MAIFDPEITSLAARVLESSRTKGWRICTAESCTGGLLSAALTGIAGSSDVFERGFVTYSNDAKMALLGVSGDSLKSHGAVSEPVAREMAAGALARAPVQIALSVTGIAGPGGSEHKPEGRVCFGLATQGGHVQTITQEFGALGRANVRRAALVFALELLLTA
jgi:nicotinamide-nucleotide amidase